MIGLNKVTKVTGSKTYDIIKEKMTTDSHKFHNDFSPHPRFLAIQSIPIYDTNKIIVV